MRLNRYQLFLMGGLALIILGPAAFTQPNFRGGKGGRGGRGMMDPETQFKQYSGGADVIDVTKVESPQWMAKWRPTEQLRETMQTFLTTKGINTGKMTLEQFKEYSDEQRKAMMSRFQKGGPPGGDKGKGGGDDDAKAKEVFGRLDGDKDNFVTKAELEKAGRWGERLLRDLDKWDGNKDGKIDLKEYTEYVKKRDGDGKSSEKKDAESSSLNKPPVVYRIGNLPVKDLPEWFVPLDRDKDAQIGLYEWRNDNRDVNEFVAVDVNSDGFVTVEELLRHKKAKELRAEKEKNKDNPSGPFGPLPNAEAPAKGGMAGGMMGGGGGMMGGRRGMGGGMMGRRAPWGGQGGGNFQGGFGGGKMGKGGFGKRGRR